VNQLTLQAGSTLAGVLQRRSRLNKYEDDIDNQN